MTLHRERNANNTPTVSYTRGSDLSGTMEGAGGIGGLLARSTGDGSTWTSHAYYHADGNGNITYMLDSTQAMAARYRYDPFGNTVSSSGTLADANVYRFSSKESHAASGLYYYGYRWYAPSLQRWPSRDPIEERGGINLYGFVENNPLNFLDTDGLAAWWPPSKWPIRIKIGPPPPPSFTPCSSKDDLAACYVICLKQNKAHGACTIVKITTKGPFGWWVQDTYRTCLCLDCPAFPSFGM